MKITPEFQVIIDAAVKDSKLSKKERKILLNRAEKEGLDLPEFELYLDSLVPAQKINWLRYGIISAVILFFLGFALFCLLLGLLWWNNGGAEARKYGCNSVDDCLTKNEFEGARAIGAARSADNSITIWDVRKIISAEVSFYLTNSEPSMAVRSLREYKFAETYKNKGWGDENEGYNEESDWYNQLVISVLPYISADERPEWIAKIRPIAVTGKEVKTNYYEHSLDNHVKDEQMKLYGLK